MAAWITLRRDDGRHVSRLVLDVAHQLARIDFRAVDVSPRVGRDALGGAAGPRPAPLLYRLGIRNERRDLAVLGAADAQPTLEAGVLGVVGFEIGRASCRERGACYVRCVARKWKEI